jgi:hypothetical protein
MRPVFGLAALVAPFILSAACASKPSSGVAPSGDPNIITYQELAKHRFTDVYDAVQALHSNWLATRGTDSFRTPSQVLVVFDDTQLGDVSSLHTINIKSVVYIRYYSGIEATARWGLDHGAGVIFVSSRNAPGSERTSPDSGGGSAPQP